MSGNTAARFNILSLSQAELVDAACDRFETTWRAGDWPCVEAYLDAVPTACRQTLLLELLKLELELRMNVGETPTVEEYRVRFPDQADAIGQIFAAIREPSGPLSTAPDDSLMVSGNDPDPDMSTISLGPGPVDDVSQFDRVLGRQLGEYLIVDRLGSGGMGVVYRALQRSAGRFVALKLIKADWWGDSTDASNHEAEVRFRNEAQANAQLEHDNIVPVYEVGHVGGLLFFSMRLIKGRTLAQMILSDGPLPPRRAAYYMEAIARAIQYAHDKKVMHRDVKPGNIMVDENDRPILIDLGLAKSLEATEYTTLTGKALGTAEYMSPEQAKGQKEVGFPTDVYGLGATLFALLTGRPPFSGPNPMVVLRKVIDEEPAWPRECDKAVGKELKAICLKCLEKDSERRIPSAGELAIELKKYLSYERGKYTLPGPGTRLVNWVRRQPWRAAAASLAFLAVLIGMATWVLNSRQSEAMADVLIRDVHRVPLADLPKKIEQMSGYRGWVAPKLRNLLPGEPRNTEARTRVLVALLPFEPESANELAERLMRCDPDEHRVIREALRGRWVENAPGWHRTMTLDSDAGRRVRAGAALLALDGSTTPAGDAWSELRLARDPSRSVELLEWLVQSKIDPEVLLNRLDVESDDSVRQMMIQCLADRYSESSSASVLAHVTRFVAMYRKDPDPGVHSSIAYLLRRSGHADAIKGIDAELAGKPRGNRRWFVNSHKQTMALIGGKDDIVSTVSEARRLPYRLAIATTETTFEQYLECVPGHLAAWRDFNLPPLSKPELAVGQVSYDQAAFFCNWLSEKEGLSQDQWCYLPGDERGKMVMAPDYLRRRGYRLPNLEEWEYAARAGTSTDRYFGRSLDHAARYAWYRKNSDNNVEPVGLKRPNALGLFDILGNVSEWCYNPNPPHTTCKCQAASGEDCIKVRRVSTRGGSFASVSTVEVLVAAPKLGHLDQLNPWEQYHFYGFRVVKLPE
jgi:eukaryotic-like serine/threonine-protein kinase